MNCICCGGSAWQVVTVLPKSIFGVSARIVKCLGCGFGRTVPAPVVCFDHYNAAGDSVANFQGRAEDYRTFARKLLADAPMSSGRLLDIGCGGGFVVEEAGLLGFDAYGVEANGAMVQWCQSRGLKVSCADVSQLDPKEKFDLVVISAVLEHLEDPAGLIVCARKMLDEHGSILISQASFDGFLPRVVPWGWYGWQPKEHFWHFTPESFRRFADRNGFDTQIFRRSLHHRWHCRGKSLLRNPLTAIVRMGGALGRGDSFNATMKPRLRTESE
jgi:SAM-dependent methyltransferase